MAGTTKKRQENGGERYGKAAIGPSCSPNQAGCFRDCALPGEELLGTSIELNLNSSALKAWKMTQWAAGVSIYGHYC